MALLDRPLTYDEVRELLLTPQGHERSWLHELSWFHELFNNPAPHVVRYRVNDGVHYTPPQEFYVGRRVEKSPSDCLWIVPGTLERGI